MEKEVLDYYLDDYSYDDVYRSIPPYIPADSCYVVPGGSGSDYGRSNSKHV